MDGIRIFNWYEYTPSYNDNVYTKVNIPMGIQSFTLEYGYHADGGLTNYSICNGETKVSILLLQLIDSVRLCRSMPIPFGKSFWYRN